MPLSDILSCSDSEVLELVTLEDPYSRGNWFLSKGIGTIELSSLGSIVGVASYDELFSGFKLVGEALPDGPWPQKIPESLVECIANLTDEQIKEYSKVWAKIDEFLGNVALEELVDYLKRLQLFIADKGKNLFLVNAL